MSGRRGDSWSMRTVTRARLPGGEAAVHRDSLAGDERGRVGTEPDHRLGDLLGPANSPNWLEPGHTFLEPGIAGQEGAGHASSDIAGADRVDPDALAGVLQRSGLGE